MKPLQSVPLTLDDELIWDHVVWSVQLCSYSEWRDVPGWARAADRRDADLMLWAQQSPLARFISTPVGEHWAVSMVAFASLVYRWRLVRCKRDEVYPDQPDITNCA